MAVTAEERSGGASSAMDLLHLAVAHPRDATSQARAILDGHPDAVTASVAHQVIGIVQRDFGDADAAIAELRAALRLARAAGAADREADVLATLGAALIQRGR